MATNIAVRLSHLFFLPFKYLLGFNISTIRGFFFVCFILFVTFTFFACVPMGSGACVDHGASMEVRQQLAGVGSVYHADPGM